MKPYKKFLTTGLVFFAGLLLFNSCSKQSNYKLNNNKGIFISTDNKYHFIIDRSIEDDAYLINISAETPGWIAVGFGQSRAMKNAEIIIASVEGDTLNIQHEFGTGYVRHESISQLDSSYDTNVLQVIKYSENNGITAVIFKRFDNNSSQYCKKFISGETINFMYAYGKTDSFENKHIIRGSDQITLP